MLDQSLGTGEVVVGHRATGIVNTARAMRRLRFGLIDHNGKGTVYARALLAAGHELVNEGPADLFLIDADPPRLLHRQVIDQWKSWGATVVLYPHGGGGANAVLQYDGLWEPYEGVDAALVTGVGQAEVLRRIEYPSPTHVVGWTYCEARPFRACHDIRHVVFAPTHPNADGSMEPEWREDNARVFRALLERDWRVTVRHIGTIAENGLWEADGVEFVNGRRHAEFVEIDAADAIVAGEGTFPTLGIARGVPTAVYRHARPLALGLPDEPARPLLRGDRYADYARYPFDPTAGPIADVLHEAARGPEPIEAWKRRFIGPPLRSGAVLALLEQLATNPAPPARLDPTRRVTTVAFADELVERPDLLAPYGAAVGPQDDATLVLFAPGLDAHDLLALAERAVAAAGLDEDALPDVLLTPLPGAPVVDRVLAERADAVLSEWPEVGALGAVPRWMPPR
jgi:hypothetical protein